MQLPERLGRDVGWEGGAAGAVDDSAWNGGKKNGEYRAALKQRWTTRGAASTRYSVVRALGRLTRGGAEDAYVCRASSARPRGLLPPDMSKFTRAEIKDMTGTSALHPHQRVHARAHLSPAHFDRWLALWCAAVDDRYADPTAEPAMVQATRVAGAMSSRITGQEPAPGAATLAPADQP